MVPNTIMFSYVQLRYPQHIPGIFSSKRLTYCQNIFGSKMAGNYSIRGQRIRILFQNNVQLQRNILKIFQGGMDGRGYDRSSPYIIFYYIIILYYIILYNKIHCNIFYCICSILYYIKLYYIIFLYYIIIYYIIILYYYVF